MSSIAIDECRSSRPKLARRKAVVCRVPLDGVSSLAWPTKPRGAPFLATETRQTITALQMPGGRV